MKPGNTPPREPPPPERACRSKARYGLEADAHRVAARCYAQRGEWLRVYACADCSGWHLTSKGAEPMPEWRPPELPANQRQQASDSERDDHSWRRRRGGHGKARRYGKL